MHFVNKLQQYHHKCYQCKGYPGVYAVMIKYEYNDRENDDQVGDNAGKADINYPFNIVI